jgi:uncharacterized protein (DUF58 family)
LLGRFSLAWWSRSLPQGDAFHVAPDSLPGGVRAVAGESAGETPRRLPGSGVELLQLRDYVSGDALSRIDWKATARRGTLISREYSEAQHLEILVVIDAGRASRVRAGDLDRLGLYANVAARLAEHAVTVEDRVGLLVYAERTLSACLPDRGLRAVTRMRHALENLETRHGESNPIPAAIQVRRMLRHRGLVVWLTDLAEPTRNEQLMQALKALVPRQLPIVAAPHAAQIDQLADAAAVEWRDPYIGIAARGHRDRAQAQIHALRHQVSRCIRGPRGKRLPRADTPRAALRFPIPPRRLPASWDRSRSARRPRRDIRSGRSTAAPRFARSSGRRRCLRRCPGAAGRDPAAPAARADS